MFMHFCVIIIDSNDKSIVKENITISKIVYQFDVYTYKWCLRRRPLKRKKEIIMKRFRSRSRSDRGLISS